MEDATLVAGLAARDERAMEALNARFGGAMSAVALRVTHNERLAEEVVQDSLMAVWREPSRFDPNRGTLGPWLMTITRHKALDSLRRAAVIQRRTADVDLELHPAALDVHDEVWLGVRRDRLYEAILSLGSDQRRALELAFIGGLTHIEVAEREGIPLGTAKSRIRLAMHKLRDHLAPTIGHDPTRGDAIRAAPRATDPRAVKPAVPDAPPAPDVRPETAPGPKP